MIKEQAIAVEQSVLSSSCSVNLILEKPNDRKKNGKMKSLLLVSCLFICSVCVSTSFGETIISDVLRSKRNAPSSRQNYRLMVREQGSGFIEKVRYDTNEKTAIFEVPAHRDLDHAIVLIDFNSNLTATRLPGKNECHVRTRSPEEPSLDLLKSSMEKVSNRRYRLQSGSRLLFSTWGIKGPADLSKLSSKVINFCRGFPILELTKYETDGVSIMNENKRSRRSSSPQFPLCTKGSAAWSRLRGCSESQWITRCKFPSRSCVYWVTCPRGLVGLRDGDGACNTNHQGVRIICCDVFCP